MIKGGPGKMSSSSGEAIGLKTVLEVYSPTLLRWIFARQRPNTDFAIAFDEDVIKLHDEFDRAEQAAYAKEPTKNPSKWRQNQRTILLSYPEKQELQEQAPFRPGFRVLANRLQIMDGDTRRTLERFYQTEVTSAADEQSFYERADCCWTWLQTHAPEEFRYRLLDSTNPLEVTAKEKPANNTKGQQFNDTVPIESQVDAALGALIKVLDRVDLGAIESAELNQIIYDDVIRATGCDAKDFFKATYQKLIGRDQGPRLPGFLKEVGRDRLIRLLDT